MTNIFLGHMHLQDKSIVRTADGVRTIGIYLMVVELRHRLTDVFVNWHVCGFFDKFTFFRVCVSA